MTRFVEYQRPVSNPETQSSGDRDISVADLGPRFPEPGFVQLSDESRGYEIAHVK